MCKILGSRFSIITTIQVPKIEELDEIKSGHMVVTEGQSIISADIQEFIANGQPKCFNEHAVLTDETNTIPHTLWEDLKDALQIGASHKLSSVRVERI